MTVKDTMMVHSIGSRGEVSNSLFSKRVSAGPQLLVAGEFCAEGSVQAKGNLTAGRQLVLHDDSRMCAQLMTH